MSDDPHVRSTEGTSVRDTFHGGYLDSFKTKSSSLPIASWARFGAECREAGEQTSNYTYTGPTDTGTFVVILAGVAIGLLWLFSGVEGQKQKEEQLKKDSVLQQSRLDQMGRTGVPDLIAYFSKAKFNGKYIGDSGLFGDETLLVKDLLTRCAQTVLDNPANANRVCTTHTDISEIANSARRMRGQKPQISAHFWLDVTPASGPAFNVKIYSDGTVSTPLVSGRIRNDFNNG